MPHFIVPSGGAGSWFRFSVIFDDPTAEGGVQLMDVSFRLIPSQGMFTLVRRASYRSF